LKKVEDGVRLG